MAKNEEAQRFLSGEVKRTQEGLRFFAEHDPARPLRLTSVRPTQAIAPEAGEQDLARHDDHTVRVAFERLEHGWVYGVTGVRPARGGRGRERNHDD